MKGSFLCILVVLYTGLCSLSQSSMMISFVNANGFHDEFYLKVQLSGRITDAKTGEPLFGASVSFQDARIGTVADAEGKYKLRNIPTGHHLVEISHTGYTSVVEHLDLTTDIERNYSLSPSIVENEGVTVTGVANATSIRNSPMPVDIMRRTDLLQSASTNIIDALAHRPGISQLTTGPGISKPIIRGLGYNRVIVVNEGSKQEGQQWGDEHGIEIDELSINKVEILKGPASLMYGSDALAGVINFITNVPVQEETVKGSILFNHQTNNKLFAFYANIAGNKNGFNWNLYGTHKSAGDYKNKFDGRVLNSRFNEGNFGGYVGLNKGWGYSHLIFSSFSQNVGLIEADRDDATGKFILNAGSSLERIATNNDLSSRKLFIPNQNIRHYKIISDNNFSINKSKLKLNIGFQNNLRKEFGNPENPQEEELFFDLKTINYNVQWALPEVKDWRTTIGINGMFQTNENKGEGVIIPEYDLLDIGGFIYTQRIFNKLTLSGGARFDNRSVDSKKLVEGTVTKFNAFNKSFSNFSGSAGISYKPADFLTLKANVAHGFRAPNMAELGSNGAHEGTNRYEYGEQNLKSETSLQLDGGTEVNYEHFSFNLSLFYNKVNDFIYYRRLQSVSGGDSLVNVNGDDLETFRFDQNNAKLSGMEVSFDLHPHPLDWLHFENSVSFVRGRFDKKIDGTNNLPLIPPLRWISELRANFMKVSKTVSNFYFHFEAEKTFDQNKPFFAYGSETSTAGYILLNAGVGTGITSKNKTIFSIHFAGTNLTDKTYQNHLSRLKYTDVNMLTGRRGIFNPGRNFSVKINIPLEFRLQKSQ